MAEANVCREDALAAMALVRHASCSHPDSCEILRAVSEVQISHHSSSTTGQDAKLAKVSIAPGQRSKTSKPSKDIAASAYPSFTGMAEPKSGIAQRIGGVVKSSIAHCSIRKVHDLSRILRLWYSKKAYKASSETSEGTGLKVRYQKDMKGKLSKNTTAWEKLLPDKTTFMTVPIVIHKLSKGDCISQKHFCKRVLLV